MTLFQRANAGLNLTPGERALLKLLQGFALAGVQAVVLALPTVFLYKAGQVALATGALGIVAGAFIHGVLAAWQKYVSAKGDQPLANAIGAVDSAVSAEFGIPNDVKTEVAPSDTSTDAASLPADEPVPPAVATPAAQ